MKNFIQPGDVLSLVAPYDTLSGAGALVGGIFGVATKDILNGATGDYAVRGVFELTKVGTQAWTQGQAIHWDNGNKRCTSVANAGPMIGAAIAPVGAGAGVVLGKVLLMPGAAGQEGGGLQAAIADVATVNATDLATSEALANQLKITVNTILAELRLAGILAP